MITKIVRIVLAVILITFLAPLLWASLSYVFFNSTTMTADQAGLSALVAVVAFICWVSTYVMEIEY